MRRIETTSHFDRALRLFIKKHPELRATIGRAIDHLAQAPFDLRYKTHPLSGRLRELHAADVTHGYRIVFLLQSDEIIFTNIGSHDDVY